MTNDKLSMILSIFEIDAKLLSKIKAYQSKDGLQNEKGLDKYIDKTLTSQTVISEIDMKISEVVLTEKSM